MKKITFEQFKKINSFNYMGSHATFRHSSEYSIEDNFYVTPDRVDDHIQSLTWKIDYENANITDQRNHIEYLNQLLIHELEDDKECTVHNGKLFTSFYFDESKKQTQKIKNNSSSKISKSKRKIKDFENNLTRLNELKEYIISLEVVEL